ncbi:RNA polymerase sigma-70 factor, ECF subfamily [Chitinophaga terrae (ex Kim and Jung 2007)]|uniref:RNA polymerase sigma-70 factor, ECF subfamily n=1 Tax=Chitinophaga terrae (ex Kim and Jung 2007) TaxID=408074 RepID=A0A1H3ZKQ2_9BACT|nr:RNA polymerase sigma-70 factor [Chitinophaga terrae (ex Kim and Jung 2007)]GEP88807.1 DNA-directed RNA polymerase sigma-70 factor [Chitinophaga terrae (ex Kim and Jung 2007)]SEA24339.1 RNA polymerase sigma-70 factor, ECF subfamily [Chitinophaga terrae (ex Kim and Jung 2007)]
MVSRLQPTNEEPLIELQRIANGDEQEFRRLFHYFSPRLNQFAFSIIRVKEAATEVVDDVFIRLWKQKEKATTIANIRVYLYVAVKNSALNYLSSKANRQITEPFNHLDIALSRDQLPDQKMISAELQKRITSAIEALPPRCKMIFKLVREDGLRYKDVAEILNLTVNTVDAQMVIAVKRIAEKVQSHFTSFPKKSVKK